MNADREDPRGQYRSDFGTPFVVDGVGLDVVDTFGHKRPGNLFPVSGWVGWRGIDDVLLDLGKVEYTNQFGLFGAELLYSEALLQLGKERVFKIEDFVPHFRKS